MTKNSSVEIQELDLRHDLPVVVTILDTQTGQTKRSDEWSKEDFSTYWWTEGNGGCDCNRRLVFDPGDLGNNNVLCRSVRFRIVAVEPLLDGYTLDDFNDGYPPQEEKT